MPGQPPTRVRHIRIAGMAAGPRPAQSVGVHDDIAQRRPGQLRERPRPAGRVDEFEVAHSREGRQRGRRARFATGPGLIGCGLESGGQLLHPGVTVVQVEQDRLIRVEAHVGDMQHGEGPQYPDRFQHAHRPCPREVVGEDAERCVACEHPVEGASFDQQFAGGAEVAIGVGKQ